LFFDALVGYTLSGESHADVDGSEWFVSGLSGEGMSNVGWYTFGLIGLESLYGRDGLLSESALEVESLEASTVVLVERVATFVVMVDETRADVVEDL
jgi:hypothetical protein